MWASLQYFLSGFIVFWCIMGTIFVCIFLDQSKLICVVWWKIQRLLGAASPPSFMLLEFGASLSSLVCLSVWTNNPKTVRRCQTLSSIFDKISKKNFFFNMFFNVLHHLLKYFYGSQIRNCEIIGNVWLSADNKNISIYISPSCTQHFTKGNTWQFPVPWSLQFKIWQKEPTEGWE